MYAQVEKPKENKRRAVANSVAQKKNNRDRGFSFVDNRHEAKKNAQQQAMMDNNSVQQHKAIQKKPNNTGLPDNLKSEIENLSGYSMDDVKVHYNSDKPAQLQAHAYAQGTDIHLASGQEKHLPHEAWHVVQQKQGRVKSTMQLKGNIDVNEDAGLEQEADIMGAKAMQHGNSPSKDLNLQYKVVNGPAQRKVGFEIETNIPVHGMVTLSNAARMEDLQINGPIKVDHSHVDGALQARQAGLELTPVSKAKIQALWPAVMGTMDVDKEALDKKYPNLATTPLPVADTLKAKILKYAFFKDAKSKNKVKEVHWDSIADSLALMLTTKLLLTSEHGLAYDRETEEAPERTEVGTFQNNNLLMHVDSSIASDTLAKSGDSTVVGNGILEIVSKPLENIGQAQLFNQAIEGLMTHINKATNNWTMQGQLTDAVWTGPVHNLLAAKFNVPNAITGTFQVNFGTTAAKYNQRMTNMESQHTNNGLNQHVPKAVGMPQMGYLMKRDIENIQFALNLVGQLESKKSYRDLTNDAKEFFKLVMTDLAIRFANDTSQGHEKNASPLMLKANYDKIFTMIPYWQRPWQGQGYSVMNDIMFLLLSRIKLIGNADKAKKHKDKVISQINHLKTKLNWSKTQGNSDANTTPAGKRVPIADNLFVAETRHHQRTHEPYVGWQQLILDSIGTHMD